jgi:hypothetical protein
MSRILVPSLACISKTEISRTRSLPINGVIKVKIGDVVNANDTIITADMPGDTVILKLAEKMGITPEEVIKNLKVQEGDIVANNTLIAQSIAFFGLLKNSYLSPLEGIVEFVTVSTGHIGIQRPSTPISKKAFIGGRVVEINDNNSVTILSKCSYLQGIFGVGGEMIGKLRVLDGTFDSILVEEIIPTNCSGEILVGGYAPTAGAIKKARNCGACGLITGSIEDQSLNDLVGYELGIALTGDEDLDFTLIITEGFGKIPMSSRITKLLSEHNGQEASITGATQVRAGAVRPEIIISGLYGEQHEIVVKAEGLNEIKKSLVPGSIVRIVRYPYFGKFATITELVKESREIASGARTRVVKLKLEEDGSEVIVPRSNIELV